MSAVASSGTASAAGNTVTWNGSLAPGGSVTITVGATIAAGTGGTTISNQGALAFDTDGDGTNDGSGVTDDPGTPAADDPTSFVVAVATAPALTGTKTAGGTPAEGSEITYTIVLTNEGDGDQPDNPGDELTDVLPPQLTLVSASATSGIAVATVGTNTVTWNGSVPAGGSVTITVTATVNPGAAGQVISNQATFRFDADNDGTNESSGVTDDPATGPAGDPTAVLGLAGAVPDIPTLSEAALVLVGLLLAGLGLHAVRRSVG